MKKLNLKLALTFVALLVGTLGTASVQSSIYKHERLRIRNTFKTPEEVVSYYCARDASGFVWSGLMDAERAAFTLWADAPQQDAFFVARKYEVHPSELIGHDPNRASVEVTYDIAAIADAHGTRMPPTEPQRKVVFDLQRVDGAWKIVKPDYAEIAPVVLESKIPPTSVNLPGSALPR